MAVNNQVIAAIAGIATIGAIAYAALHSGDHAATPAAVESPSVESGEPTADAAEPAADATPEDSPIR